MANPIALGQRIKYLRNERDWTQKELAKRSGLGRGYIAQLEKGFVGKPSADTFLKLAHAFNISEKELYQAAGYIQLGFVEKEETPAQLIESLKLNVRRLEKMFKDHHNENDLKEQPG